MGVDKARKSKAAKRKEVAEDKKKRSQDEVAAKEAAEQAEAQKPRKGAKRKAQASANAEASKKPRGPKRQRTEPEAGKKGAKSRPAADGEAAESGKKPRAAKSSQKADGEAETRPRGAKEAGAEAEKPRGPKRTAKKTKAHRLEEMQKAADAEPEVPRGTIYLGHLPEGFFEPQMRRFFEQFGTVTRLRLSRSKKNARSKGYAFIEFEDEGVAKIVAETMDKYLLFGQKLVCHVYSKEKQHPKLWRGCNKKMKNLAPIRFKNHLNKVNKRPQVEVDGEQLPCRTTRQEERREKANKKLKGKLAALGVDFDLEDVLGTTPGIADKSAAR